jgi:excisionase family DNA binding protein
LLRWKSGRDALPFDPPGFLTIAEAAPFFGVSVRTLRRRISAGLLRCERRGRGPNALICFKREDVEADSGVKACWNAGTRAWVPIL